MASDVGSIPELDQKKYDADEQVKIICLGDSAVGKSKLMERFLMDEYYPLAARDFQNESACEFCLKLVNGLTEGEILNSLYSRPQQLSTYALTLYKHTATIGNKTVAVDFWDTAGQERFQSMHPSYYHKAHACIMVFDVQRKITYKNLANWYKELREYRPEIPCCVVANKIDADLKVTQRSFNFGKKQGLPFYFVSAADGTNVVKMFREMIKKAVDYKQNPSDFMDEVMQELENFDLEKNEIHSETDEDGLKGESPDLV